MTGCGCALQSSCCFQTIQKPYQCTREEKIFAQYHPMAPWDQGYANGGVLHWVHQGRDRQPRTVPPPQSEEAVGTLALSARHWAPAWVWAWAGVGPGRCPVGESQEHAWWGESRPYTAPVLLGRAERTAPSEPRDTDQMRAAVCCDQGMTWAPGKVLGPRGMASKVQPGLIYNKVILNFVSIQKTKSDCFCIPVFEEKCLNNSIVWVKVLYT